MSLTSRKIILLILGALFIGVLLVIGGWFGYTSTSLSTTNSSSTVPVSTGQTQDPQRTALSGGRVIVDGYSHGFTYKPDPSYPGASLNAHLFFKSSSGEMIQVPDTIWFKIYATSAFAETGKHGGESLESFDMPVNPWDKNIIYLSTSEPLDQSYSRITNRIYSYDLKTAELKQIYSETVENNSPLNTHMARIVRTVGIDGSKVIVLYDTPGNSPGPCTDIWSDYKDQMGYLELADISAGLKSYAVPPYKVAEGQREVQKCLDSLN